MAYQLIDPDSKVDFTCDFSDLLDSGVEITGSPTWSITPTGPTLEDQSNTATAATTFISGCTLGRVYSLTCQIVTDKAVAQTFDRSISLRCEQR